MGVDKTQASAIELTREEIETIAEDCFGELESTHIGGLECEQIETCPADHFDIEDPVVRLRQDLIRKLGYV